MKNHSIGPAACFLASLVVLGSPSLLGGPTDGTVVGAFKIVDNGPDAQRYNIVLISDGYQASELANFAQHAQQFADFFFNTPPFNTNCSLFNIWRVDVSSTDSGADDPAACGDGSTGDGTSVNTYFDATFCGDGATRRLLTVNGTTAQNVLNAQVPNWDSALVIVNTTKYGGAGGIPGTTSLSGNWELIAIHELGHSAFGLADEYEYWNGCGADAPGTRDNHPNSEPANENVTVETVRTMVKWRDLIAGSTAVPTTVNADCSMCDPQANPFPGTTLVGLYEGAHYYHCDAYRPVFDCMMRNFAPFCPVCVRRILNVLAPFRPANTPPTCNAGGPYAAECTGTTSVALDGRASADRDCNPLTLTWSGPFVGGTATGVQPTVQFLGAGNFTVTLTVSDGVGSSTCTASVSISDTHAPVIVCPATIVRPTSPGRCDAVVTFSATALDQCDPTPTITCTPPSGSVFPKGTTTVLCNATDDSANASSCAFQVSIVDTEPPVPKCPANIVQANDPGLCSAVVGFVATVTDNCPGATVSCLPPSGTVFPKGVTPVTCTAVDASGNRAQCGFTVTVLDLEPPRVSVEPGTNPSGRNIPKAGQNPKSGQNPDGFYKLTAKDNCDPNARIYVRDSASAFVAGPFASGQQIKLVQAPGRRQAHRTKTGGIEFIHLKGDARIYGVDADGNASVPIPANVAPPPK